MRQRTISAIGSTLLIASTLVLSQGAQARVRYAHLYEPQIASEEGGESGHAIQSGQASWYGPGFSGRRTASGEVFNPHALTAAHRSLPFGTHVRVVNQRTGRSVVVRINDRGPFVRGRIIDLSRASAQALGISGAAPVKLVSLN